MTDPGGFAATAADPGTTPDTIRVVVADDQALVRVGFCGIIAATPGFTVVGEAGNGAEAVEVAQRTRPDVILMDVRMPVMDGIEATRRITQSTDVRALILTTFDLDEYVFAALHAGASGFLLKDTLPADLLTAIRVVAAGDALLAPSVTRRLIGEFTRTAPAASPIAAPSAQGTQTAGGWRPGSTCDLDQLTRVLTERELEVLTMVARGMSNGEVAEQLTISPATAKTHVAHLLTKLGARDRIQLVITAYQSGLVKLEPKLSDDLVDLTCDNYCAAHLMTFTLSSAYPLASARAKALWCSRPDRDSRAVEADVAVRAHQPEHQARNCRCRRAAGELGYLVRVNLKHCLAACPEPVQRQANPVPARGDEEVLRLARGYRADRTAVNPRLVPPEAVAVKSLLPVQPDDALAPRGRRRFTHERGLPSPGTAWPAPPSCPRLHHRCAG
jgi:DNA-binding NarL/FixJ family response regulator